MAVFYVVVENMGFQTFSCRFVKDDDVIKMADTEEREKKRAERRLKRKEKLAQDNDVNGELTIP